MPNSLPPEPDTRDHLVLVDGHALIYRAYHAFPGLSTSTGELVNAVYGFSRILLTAINDLSPTYLAVTFDSKGPTKRAERYEQYKAHRPPMPCTVHNALLAWSDPYYQKSPLGT